MRTSLLMIAALGILIMTLTGCRTTTKTKQVKTTRKVSEEIVVE